MGGFLIAAAAIAAGVAVGGGVLGGDAKRKAANARKDALKKMEMIDLGKEQAIALKADQERFANQLKLQKDVDPTVAALREKGAQGVLDTLYTDQDKQAESLGTQLYNETLQDTPGSAALKEKLLADANADLARGADLPPEFQAELVRTGLENAGKAGFAPGAEGAAGRTVRGYLGSAGLALKEARRKAAVDSGKAVQDMNATRASILSRVIPTLNSITAARAQRAGLAFNLGENAIPEAGLSGAESANLDLARIALANKKALALGEVNREKATAEGEMWSKILSAGGSLAGSIVGGFGEGGALAGMLNSTSTNVPKGTGGNTSGGSGTGYEYIWNPNAGGMPTM